MRSREISGWFAVVGVCLVITGLACEDGDKKRLIEFNTDEVELSGVATGDQVVPPVVTAASGRVDVLVSDDDFGGTAELTLLAANAEAITGVTLHLGVEGENGSEIASIPVDPSGVSVEGDKLKKIADVELTGEDFTSVPSAGFDGSVAAFTSLALEGRIHAVFLTVANPGGELRAQLRIAKLNAEADPMSGDQEVPPVDTTASGSVKFELNKADNRLLDYSVVLADVQDVFEVSVYLGGVGNAGALVARLFEGAVSVGSEPETIAEGTLGDDDILELLQLGFPGRLDDLLRRMAVGDTYVNVHTLGNPAGEIRGQVVVEDLIFDVELELEQPAMPIDPDAEGTVEITEKKNKSEIGVDSQNLDPGTEYTVELVNLQGVSEVLLSATAGSDGKLKETLKFTDGDPLPLGLTTLAEVGGFLLLIRNENGEVVLQRQLGSCNPDVLGPNTVDLDGDGRTPCDGDCDDGDPAVNPDATEVLDGKDNDCDGSVDNVEDPDSDGDGVPDSEDGCPQDPNKTEPDACGCGVSDSDGDSDGTPDCNDGCPGDPNKTAPGDCGCDVPETDSDGDGTPDCIDGCPDDANKTAPGDCGCGEPEADSDGDGTPDCIDGCPDDPGKTEPGVCGCGVSDTDGDSDGTPDCIDGCPDDPAKTEPGVCGCGVPETDSDGDGTPDCIDSARLIVELPGEAGGGAPDEQVAGVSFDVVARVVGVANDILNVSELPAGFAANLLVDAVAGFDPVPVIFPASGPAEATVSVVIFLAETGLRLRPELQNAPDIQGVESSPFSVRAADPALVLPVLPGQTLNEGTEPLAGGDPDLDSGIGGDPFGGGSIGAGVPFDVRVLVTDDFFNVVETAALPAGFDVVLEDPQDANLQAEDVDFAGVLADVTVEVTSFRAALDHSLAPVLTSSGTLTPVNSDVFVVDPGAAEHIIMILPGQTHNAGVPLRADGTADVNAFVTGTPDPQTETQPFVVFTRAVDRFGNVDYQYGNDAANQNVVLATDDALEDTGAPVLATNSPAAGERIVIEGSFDASFTDGSFVRVADAGSSEIADVVAVDPGTSITVLRLESSHTAPNVTLQTFVPPDDSVIGQRRGTAISGIGAPAQNDVPRTMIVELGLQTVPVALPAISPGDAIALAIQDAVRSTGSGEAAAGFVAAFDAVFRRYALVSGVPAAPGAPSSVSGSGDGADFLELTTEGDDYAALFLSAADASDVQAPTQLRFSRGIAVFELDPAFTGSAARYVVALEAPGGGAPTFAALSSPFSLAQPQLVFTSSPLTAVAGGTFDLTVEAQDADGSTVAVDGTLTLSLDQDPGGQGFSGPATALLTNGVAVFSGVSLTVAQTGYVFRAAGTDFTDGLSPPVAVVAADPAAVQITQQPADSEAGETLTVAGNIVDAFLNPTAGFFQVDATLVQGTGPLLGTTSVDTGGSAIWLFDDLRIEAASALNQIEVAVLNLTSSSTVPFAVDPGPGVTIDVLVESTGGGAGDPLDPVVLEIQDSFGNRDDSDSSTVVDATLAIGTGSLFGTTQETAVAGVVTFANLRYDTAGTIQVSFNSPGLTGATSGDIPVAPGAPSRLEFTQIDTDVETDETFTAAVGLFDAFDNVATNAADDVTLDLAAGAGVLSGTLTRTPTLGVAVFDDLSHDTAETIQLRASTLPGLEVISPTITVSAAQRFLVFVQDAPAPVTAGQTFPVTVEVQDASGNVDTSDNSTTATLSLAAGSGVLDGLTTAPAFGGVLDFIVFIEQADTGYQLQVDAASFTPIVGSLFDVVAGAFVQLPFTGPPPATVQEGVPFSVEVTKQDFFGNTVTAPESTVTIVLLDLNPTALSGSTVTTTIDGVGTFGDLTITEAGTARLQVSAEGVTEISEAFTVEPAAANTPPVVSNLSVGGTQGGVPISFTLSDSEGDDVDLRVEFQAGPTAPLRRITFLASGSHDGFGGTVAVRTSPGGVSHQILWDTTADFAQTTTSTAAVFVTPVEHDTGVIGTPASATDLAIENGLSFASAVATALPGSSVDVDAADLNNDGRVDVVLATPAVSAFLVFEQDATGALQLVDTPTSFDPTAVTAADLVPGGRLEIAGADGSSNEILVFAFDSGLGVYGLPTTIAVGTSPNAVIAVDVDQNGLLDLVTANSGSDDVSVVLQLAPGSFSPAASHPVGLSPTSLATGDLNRDGPPDLLVANAGGSSFSVLLADPLSPGSFLAHQEIALAASPEQLLLVELNGDARLDAVVLAAVVQPGDRLLVLLGDGAGAFSTDQNIDLAGLGALATGVVAGDLTGDGGTELALARLDGGVAVFTQGSDGNFELRTTHPTGTGTSALALADLNVDGRPDLFTADDAELNTLLNTTVRLAAPDGTLRATQNERPFGAPVALATADMNRDGRFGVITVSRQGTTGFVNVHAGHGDGALCLAYVTGLPGVPGDIAIADQDGDTFPDVYVLIPSFGVAVLTHQDPFDDYSVSPSPTILPVGLDPRAIDTGDIDHDGTPDVVILDGTGELTAHLSSGASVPPISVPTGGTDVLLRRLDSDGELDVAIASPDLNVVEVRLGDGAGNFSSAGSLTVTGALAVEAGDLDLDGFNDLAVSGSTGVVTFLGSGAGSFSPAPGGQVPLDGVTGLTLADVDVNGTLDVVVSGEQNAILANDGSGGLSIDSTFRIGGGTTGVATADLSNNGRPDPVFTTPSMVAAIKNTAAGLQIAPDAGFDIGASVAVGDFNLDGFLDGAGTTTSTIAIAFGTQTGDLTVGEILDFGGQVADWGDVFDHDADGDSDLVAGYAGIGVVIWANDGNGAFNSSVVLGAGDAHGEPAIGDLDLNGRQDIAASISGDDRIAVFFQGPTGTFTETMTAPVSPGPKKVELKDVNNDGYIDLLSVDLGDSSVWTLLNDGTGGFLPATPFCVATGGAPPCPPGTQTARDLVVTDLNNDAKKDIAVLFSSPFSSQIALFEGDGAGLFTPVSSFIFFEGEGTLLASVDFDQNGFTDLGAYVSTDETWTVFTGEDGFFYTQFPHLLGGGPYVLESLAVPEENDVDATGDEVEADPDDFELEVVERGRRPPGNPCAIARFEYLGAAWVQRLVAIGVLFLPLVVLSTLRRRGRSSRASDDR